MVLRRWDFLPPLCFKDVLIMIRFTSVKRISKTKRGHLLPVIVLILGMRSWGRGRMNVRKLFTFHLPIFDCIFLYCPLYHANCFSREREWRSDKKWREKKYPRISVVFSIDLLCKYIVISLLLCFDLPWTASCGGSIAIPCIPYYV